MRAYCLIRDLPWYRKDAFMSGLSAAGLRPETKHPQAMTPETLLVIWNRYGGNHEIALQCERAGGRVWVAENGYIGAGGGSPKFQVHPGGPQPHHYYAVSEGYHNGGGREPAGGGERWAALGLELKPWRTSGEYLLICPNRSFGVPGRIMPPDWAETRAAALRRAQALPVRVRPHPGNNAPARPLADDLAGARAVFVWSSTAGVHALVEGIPTYCDAPAWIAKGAAASGPVDAPILPERLPVMERLGWAQWTMVEIERGDPFRALLA